MTTMLTADDVTVGNYVSVLLSALMLEAPDMAAAFVCEQGETIGLVTGGTLTDQVPDCDYKRELKMIYELDDLFARLQKTQGYELRLIKTSPAE